MSKKKKNPLNSITFHNTYSDPNYFAVEYSSYEDTTIVHSIHLDKYEAATVADRINNTTNSCAVVVGGKFDKELDQYFG